ncbi:restriction endonuclease subunit S [Protofrankia coriariae]|uniref:restriction endonuclease subunit S n=1 Tax=Protofrankia coriariae TaxID=1562887 RepID=UPI0006406CF2|nr:restriction endonuclease subunit S [Protofrankia coriariae]
MEKIDERIPGVDLPLMSVSQTRGVIRRSELTDAPQRAESLDNYKVCRTNDIVFNKMSIRSGAMGVAAEDGLVTYHYEVMRPREGTDPRFIAYLMKSSWFTEELIKRERGIGAGDQANVRTTEVPFSALKTIDVYIPNQSEQRAIANYLDRETVRIDTLIEEQRRLIEMLRERRTAVIAHATSKGTEVEFRRVITALRQGWSPNCENWPADGVTEWGVLKVGCANTGRFQPAENKRLPDDENPRPEFALRRGELVMSRSNTKDLVGAAAVVDDDYPRLLLSDLTYGISLASDADPVFVAFALGSPAIRVQISAASKGMSHTMQKISQRDIRELRIRLPDPDEQHRIATYLDEQTAKIDTLIAEAERFIELSKERRAALVTAAVTGQVDVRELV